LKKRQRNCTHTEGKKITELLKKNKLQGKNK